MPLPALPAIWAGIKAAAPVFTAIGQGMQGFGAAKAQKDQAAQARRQAEQQQRYSYADLGQSDRQFGQTSNLERSKYLDERGIQASALRNQMNRLPLADRAAYMLAARAGAAPAPFQARDFTRGTTPGAGQATGGYAEGLAAQRTAAGQYTTGAGGMMYNPELEGAINRLNSMAGVPGEYGAQSPMKTQLEAALAEQMQLAATGKSSEERAKAQAAVIRIRQMLQQLGG